MRLTFQMDHLYWIINFLCLYLDSVITFNVEPIPTVTNYFFNEKDVFEYALATIRRVG